MLLSFLWCVDNKWVNKWKDHQFKSHHNTFCLFSVWNWSVAEGDDTTFQTLIQTHIHLLFSFQDRPKGVQQHARLQAAGGAGHPQRGPFHPRCYQPRGEGEAGAHAGEAASLVLVFSQFGTMFSFERGNVPGCFSSGRSHWCCTCLLHKIRVNAGLFAIQKLQKGLLCYWLKILSRLLQSRTLNHQLPQSVCDRRNTVRPEEDWID